MLLGSFVGAVFTSLLASRVDRAIVGRFSKKQVEKQIGEALDEALERLRKAHPDFPMDFFDEDFLRGSAEDEFAAFLIANGKPNPQAITALFKQRAMPGVELAKVLPGIEAFVEMFDKALLGKPAFTQVVLARLTTDTNRLTGELKEAVQAALELSTPSPTPATTRFQLPPAPADFVDRPEVEQIVAALRNGSAAVSAVEGMGGIGKTVAALVAAHRLAEEGLFPDAQIFIDLRGYTPGAKPMQPDEALRVLLRPFLAPNEELPQARTEGETTVILGQLWRERTRDLRMLLFLDNARDEADVRPLLTGHAECATVVTSRVKLTLPDVTPVSLETLKPEAAAELARRRANRRNANRITEAQSHALAEACGYLPLAIEIAAATLDVQPALDVLRFIADIADRSRSLPDLKLRGGSSLRATLLVSLETLTEEECALWQALGVFDGGFDEAAATAVWEAEDAGTTLGALYERHLIRYDNSSTRYALHDLVRALALEALADNEPDAEGVRLRHAMHYLVKLAEANELYRSARETDGLALLDLELQNIRASQAWAVRPGSTGALLAQYFSNYACLVVRLAPLEHIAWLDASLAAARASQDKRGMADTYGYLGLCNRTRGEFERAEEMFRQSLALNEDLGRKGAMASVLDDRANLFRARGELDQAEEMYGRSLALNEELGLIDGMARNYGNLGNLYQTRGELDRAEEMYRQSLAIDEKLGGKDRIANQYGNLGTLSYARGEFDRAEEMFRRSLALNEELGRKEGMANQYGNLGTLSYARGEFDRAEDMYGRCLALNEELGRKEGMASTYINLGSLHYSRGQLDRAEEMYGRCLALNEELGRREDMATAYANLGILNHARGELVLAEDMYRRSIALFRELGAQHMVEKAEGWLRVLRGGQAVEHA